MGCSSGGPDRRQFSTASKREVKAEAASRLWFPPEFFRILTVVNVTIRRRVLNATGLAARAYRVGVP